MSYPAKILLIKLVKQHEELWNSRSPHYSRADMKKQAWDEIAARMAANGFESNIGRLRVIWKNLRDQWKRNLSLKAHTPPEKEWYFQRRINFLAETYDDGGRGGLIYCHHTDDDEDNDEDSPDMCEAPNDSLYSVKPDVYDSLEKDYATEGSLLIGSYRQNNSPAPNVEPKSEKQDGLVCGETLLTIMEEQVNGGGSTSHPVNSARASTSSAQDAEPFKKRLRKEVKSDGPSHSRIQECSSTSVPSPHASSKEPDNDASQQSENKSENKGDKFDKYAAFVASTLREMPEAEARRRMKELTVLLLEGLD